MERLFLFCFKYNQQNVPAGEAVFTVSCMMNGLMVSSCSPLPNTDEKIKQYDQNISIKGHLELKRCKTHFHTLFMNFGDAMFRLFTPCSSMKTLYLELHNLVYCAISKLTKKALKNRLCKLPYKKKIAPEPDSIILKYERNKPPNNKYQYTFTFGCKVKMIQLGQKAQTHNPIVETSLLAPCIFVHPQ